MSKPQVSLGKPLTEAQLVTVHAVCDEWMQIGLSTERCDRPRAEAAVRAAYAAAGLGEPAVIVWMESPLGGVFASAAIRELIAAGQDQLGGQLGGQLRDQLGGQLRDQLWNQLGDQLWGQLRGQLWNQLGGQLGDQLRGQLWNQLGDQLWDQLGGQLGGQLWGQLGGQLGDQLWDQLGGQLGGQLWGQLGGQLWGQLWGQLRDQLWDQLWDQLGGQLRDQLGDQLGDQLWGQLRGQLWNQLGGQLGDQLRGQLGGQLWDQLRDQLGKEISLWWDCYWLAYMTCALPLAGLENSARLDALAEACRHTGWWWPMRGVAVLTDHPTVLKRDDEGRLHSGAGPALLYADGYALYAWHGIRVPAWVIDEPSVEKALTEPNTEIRRATFEAIGWDAVVDHLGVAPIDTCSDPGNAPHELKLYRLPAKVNPYGQPVNLLIMTNGSPDRSGELRCYGETVPASITSAVEAAAWQYGIEPDVYQQLARRT